MHRDDCFPPRPEPRQSRPVRAVEVFSGAVFSVWQWSEEVRPGVRVKFEIVERPDTALVLPLVSPGKVLLGLEQQPGMRPMLRAIGGRVEPDECPIGAARRELREEAGLEAKVMVLLHAWQPVNKMDWAVHVFLARGLEHIPTWSSPMGERVELKVFSVHDLFDASSELLVHDYELQHLFLGAGPAVEARLRFRELAVAPVSESGEEGF